MGKGVGKCQVLTDRVVATFRGDEVPKYIVLHRRIDGKYTLLGRVFRTLDTFPY